MNEFRKLTLDDKSWVDLIMSGGSSRGCENSFAAKFIWQEAYNITAAEICGCFVSKVKYNGRVSVNYPVGAPRDRINAVAYIMEYQKSAGESYCFHGLEQSDIDEMNTVFPDTFEFIFERDDCDYVYLSEDLIELKGKKYQSKRNHIRRFCDEPMWSFEEISEQNIPECLDMNERWYNSAENKSIGIRQDHEALKRTLNYFNRLGLKGGLIRRRGEIAAFAVGEPLSSDTFVVHFEKARHDIQGAYPIINREFARHFCRDCKYINREEDAGELNLRRAKLSYHPIFLVEKHRAVPIGAYK